MLPSAPYKLKVLHYMITLEILVSLTKYTIIFDLKLWFANILTLFQPVTRNYYSTAQATSRDKARRHYSANRELSIKTLRSLVTTQVGYDVTQLRR